MLNTLLQRNFALLWVAGLISMIGNWALFTALPFYVFERTESALASGMIWLAYAVPGLLIGSVAGVLVDRWDRRRTMVIVSAAQAVLVLGLLLATRDGWLWIVYVVAFFQAVLGWFFAPAENALLPRLVGEDRLLTANALNSLNDNLARIIGPAVGGLLATVSGLRGVVLVDSATYAIAAVLIALIAVPAASSAPASASAGVDAASAWGAVWREWREGLALVRAERVLSGVFLVAGIAMFADSILTALLVPFVNEVASGGAAALGVIFTVRGISGLLGGVVIGRFGHLFRPGVLMGWSLIAIGALFAVEVNLPLIPVIIGLTLALGPAIVGWLSSQQTLLQTGAADHFRGRVFGAFGTTLAVMTLIGTGLASLLADRVGIVPMLNLSAALYAAAGVVALVRLRRYALHATGAPAAGPAAPAVEPHPAAAENRTMP